MKKIYSIIAILIFCMAFAGCSQTGGQSATDTGEEISQSRNDNEVNASVETPQEDSSSAESGDAGQPTEDFADMNTEFDLEKGTVRLNNGTEMPILGIGTFRLSDEQAENSVYWALRDGYRLIDTARIYGNEVGVGRGIQRAIDEGFVTREEIFVTTKMWTDDYDDGDSAIENSLNRLGLDYIDAGVIIGTS